VPVLNFGLAFEVMKISSQKFFSNQKNNKRQ